MKLIILIFLSYSILFSSSINILDSKKIDALHLDDLSITELSALAYNDRILYTLSDKGYLVKFKLDIENKKISTLNPFSAKYLKNKKGKPLKKKKSDSEGMDYVDGKLLISFERKPRAEYFTLDALKIKKIKINKQLLDVKNYRDKNKMLEAIAYSEKYGVLTAPELPLKQFNKCNHTLYTKKHTYSFNSCEKITALEFISEDEVLILFRNMDLAIFNLANLKLINLDTEKEFNNYRFEGLTKIDENLYLIVSDNNDSLFQKTLFVLFEIRNN